MKNVKAFIVGLLVGATLLMASTTFASEVYKKANATVRNDIKVVVNNKNLDLMKSPLSLDGSTYIYIRDLEKVFNKEVKWNANTQSIEISSLQEPTPSGGSKMEEVGNTIEPKYGFEKVFNQDGKEFVNFIEAQSKLSHIMFLPNPKDGILSLVNQDKEVVIENVPFTRIQSYWAVEYSYFVNTIQTLDI